MKTLGCIIILASVFFLRMECYCQTTLKISEENLIDVPEWAFDDERTKIRKIEAKDTLTYYEYMQLSVSYAEIGGNKLKISAMADSAFLIDKLKSCRDYKFILENQKDWALSEKYNKLVNRKLKKYDCNNL